MSEAIQDLFSRCQRARANGEDFPAIWTGILKGDPLTRGSPIQGHDGKTTTLSVRLSGGAVLVFDGETFVVKREAAA